MLNLLSPTIGLLHFNHVKHENCVPGKKFSKKPASPVSHARPRNIPEPHGARDISNYIRLECRSPDIVPVSTRQHSDSKMIVEKRGRTSSRNIKCMFVYACKQHNLYQYWTGLDLMSNYWAFSAKFLECTRYWHCRIALTHRYTFVL